MTLRLVCLLVLLGSMSACSGTNYKAERMSAVEFQRVSDLRRMFDHPNVFPVEPYSCFDEQNSTIVNAASAFDDLNSTVDAALAGDAGIDDVRGSIERHVDFVRELEISPLADTETTTCFWQHIALAVIFGEVIDGVHVVPEEIDEFEYNFEPWLESTDGQ